MEKQQAELQAFLAQNALTTVLGRSAPELRKLPLWGVSNIADKDINFSWPNAEDAHLIAPIESIRFWFKDTNTVCMRGVQFFHTNQVSSPRFSTGDLTQVCIGVDGEVIKHTRQVQACCRETQRDSIKSIAFFDKNGTQLFDMNHYRREIGVPLPIAKLEPSEEIIGGYGVSNRQKFITSFGFIVLKRPH
jgi:hypothetical protein|mmetsp:Transcript_11682/g.15854  ORF Transcript_11682/g.15854 Transcript_11682/m.15854 type:complete len:190 (+) Transcript_11682:421-990(+)